MSSLNAKVKVAAGIVVFGHCRHVALASVASTVGSVLPVDRFDLTTPVRSSTPPTSSSWIARRFSLPRSDPFTPIAIWETTRAET